MYVDKKRSQTDKTKIKKSGRSVSESRCKTAALTTDPTWGVTMAPSNHGAAEESQKVAMPKNTHTHIQHTVRIHSDHGLQTTVYRPPPTDSP